MSRTDYEQAAAKINARLPSLKKGTLRFFGDWFGRPWDNVHRILEAEVVGDDLVMVFDEGERLTVTKPSGFEVGREIFRINDAEIVRWEWYSYGEPHAAENFGSLTYTRKDGEIAVDDEVRWREPREHAVDPHAPAVELV